MADAARTRVLAEHTSAHRAEMLERYTRERPIAVSRRPRSGAFTAHRGEP